MGGSDRATSPGTGDQAVTTMTLPVYRAAYSDRSAALMAGCSAAAYSSGENLEAELGDLGLLLVHEFCSPVTDTQGYLARTDTFAVLAFRGTSSARDVWTDLKARRRGGLHRGFVEAWVSIALEVQVSLASLSPDLPIYFTGHSLGAGLATIAAKSLNVPIAALYTFGSPRVGVGKLDEEIRAPIYRLIHCADGVPLIPFWSMGYRHVGDVRYITTKGRIRRCPGLVSMLCRRLGRLVRTRFRAWVGDHNIETYREKLVSYAAVRNPGHAQ